MEQNYEVWSNEVLIYDGSNINEAYMAIEEDYKKYEVGFGEYIDSVVIKASVEDTLILLGKLYLEFEDDVLCKYNKYEDWIDDFSNEEALKLTDYLKFIF